MKIEKILEEDKSLEIIWDIQDYADRNPWFDCKFVDSVSNYLKKNGFITKKQYEILIGIFEKYRISEFRLDD